MPEPYRQSMAKLPSQKRQQTQAAKLAKGTITQHAYETRVFQRAFKKDASK
jgi:hypothetical protein